MTHAPDAPHAPGRFDHYDYGRVAFIYDALARLYSFGRIGQTKRAHLAFVKPGTSILYPGIGSGDEALAAARAGARVIGLDVSPRMLRRAEARFHAEGLSAEFVCIDAARYRPEAPVDLVVANYFLNLFEPQRAEAMLAHLVGCLAPNGAVSISDFARPGRGRLARGAAEFYYRPANWIAWALGLCAMHPILDYEPMLASLNFTVVHRERFSVSSGSDPAYEALFAKRRPE